MAAALLTALDEGLQMLGFEQIDELVLRQGAAFVLSVPNQCSRPVRSGKQSNKRTESMSAFLLFPGVTRAHRRHKLRNECALLSYSVPGSPRFTTRQRVAA
jgi:hypothetical protein